VAAGEEVAREGEESDGCWVVARGHFGSVHARLPGAPLQTFGVGDVVGAAALLHAAPMVASVACRSRGGPALTLTLTLALTLTLTLTPTLTLI
jgi:CRP-like cAMP-binding protein